MELKECCEKYLQVVQPLSDRKSEVRVCTCDKKFAVIYLENGNRIIAAIGTELKLLT